MDVLVALGTSAAYLFSATVTLLGIHEQHVYFEAGAAIITLVLMGKLLEARAKTRTSAAIEQLLRLQPRRARVERTGGRMEEVDVSQVRPADVFHLRAGERAGGRRGAGAARPSMRACSRARACAGERPGAKVFAGTQNLHGWLRCRATHVGSDTQLAEIVRLVGEAQGTKAPIQRLADRISGLFVPAVLVVALATFATWWIATGAFTAAHPGRSSAGDRLPLRARLGHAHRHHGGQRPRRSGVLVRNAAALERAGRSSRWWSTRPARHGGPPAGRRGRRGRRQDDNGVLRLAASLEQGSEHPWLVLSTMPGLRA
jgi:Cu+-exporting ATPase